MVELIKLICVKDVPSLLLAFAQLKNSAWAF